MMLNKPKPMRKFTILVLSLLIYSCNNDDDKQVIRSDVFDVNTSVADVPDGQTGVISGTNFSGQGAQTNLNNTTVLINGLVIMDDLAVNGLVEVPSGDTLIVNGDLQVSGGGQLIVEGVLITDNLTQIGEINLSGAQITVNGKYTVAGGVSLELSETYLKVNEFVLIGNISADYTLKYSLISAIGTKYFNRAGGTKICGNVLFTTSNNQGTYQEVPNQYLLGEGESLPLIYEDALYRYLDNCQ